MRTDWFTVDENAYFDNEFFLFWFINIIQLLNPFTANSLGLGSIAEQERHLCFEKNYYTFMETIVNIDANINYLQWVSFYDFVYKYILFLTKI